jgi:hypothetical protein
VEDLLDLLSKEISLVVFKINCFVHAITRWLILRCSAPTRSYSWRYGRLLKETGYMYFTTQAWTVLHKCWKGFKITKDQDDVKKMRYYAEGIRKSQNELGLEVASFPNLGLYGTDEDGSSDSAKKPLMTSIDLFGVVFDINFCQCT